MSIYFTSDLHLRHRLMLSMRGFEETEQMNEAIIKGYNSVVKQNDFVWLLGDIGFGKFSEILNLIKRLNGRKNLILGNHDQRYRKDYIKSGIFQSVQDYIEIKYEKQRISLMHYPFLTWSASSYGSWNLHGHSHCNIPFDPNIRRLDVGIDGRENFEPYSYEEIRTLFNNPEEFQYFKHKIIT